MTAPPSAPKTTQELQIALRLDNENSARELINAFPVTEAYRKYANRCLSSGYTNKSLPDWKDVDEYIYDLRASRAPGGKPLREVVKEHCKNKPFELLPHATLFSLRIVEFFRSEKGIRFNMPLRSHKAQFPLDRNFDLCKRTMILLGFMVNQSRERKERRASELEEAQVRAGKGEKNWI
ncbi:hypothetical protein F5B19DRAFT_287225 [Rostrohypoxylon terebratum]|nr:hypothetical protein F5B19DRAFT_287225 [Rostrohypoxylon terebratum]